MRCGIERVFFWYSLLLDYDDYENDIKIEKPAAKYLAFVKRKRNPVHYIV